MKIQQDLCQEIFLTFIEAEGLVFSELRRKAGNNRKSRKKVADISAIS